MMWANCLLDIYNKRKDWLGFLGHARQWICLSLTPACESRVIFDKEVCTIPILSGCTNTIQQGGA